MNNPTRKHILLTVLGVGPQPTTYVLDGRSQEATVAPAALYALLPEADRPDRVLALCTPEAADASLPALRTGLGVDCPVEEVRISSEANDEAIHLCLTKLADRVPEEVDLTVDVTHGPRHFSFLMYIGVLYLTALRGVRLRAAYYGLLNRDVPSPFLDVRPLVELPHWFHAVRVLKDTGSAYAMAGLVAASGGNPADQVGAALRDLSESYESGLPVELGHLARRFLAEQRQPLQELLQEQRLPLVDELVHDFTAVLEGQQLAQDRPEQDWKRHVPLDRAELERLAGIIDGFLARDDYPTAFRMMREWLVLWARWCTGARGHWLNYRDRQPTERQLHKLKDRAGKGLTADQETVAEAWGHLTDLRNAYAHHGLDMKVRLSTEEEVARPTTELIRVWQQTLRTVPEFSLDLPRPGQRMLVSPVGLRPGVLFSALRAAGPERVSRCLVICSAESEGAIRQACEAAGYTGEVTPLLLDDPFPSVEELERRLPEAKQYLLDAGEVFVNVTGGTTLMGVLADRIAGRMRPRGRRDQSDRRVYRFALVDRRSAVEQEADPYQAGEVCWLDGTPGEEEPADD